MLKALVSLVMVCCGVLSAQSDKAASKPLFRDPVYDGAADPAVVWDRANHKWLLF